MNRVGFLLSRLFIRQCLGSTLLPCRCHVGIYQTRRGKVVRIVDVKDAGCVRHTQNGLLPDDPGALGEPAALHALRVMTSD